MSIKRLLFILAGCSLITAAANADPGLPDTVRTPEVQINPGDHFSYPIYLYNDENLTGGTLGFQWYTGDLVLDSISYVGSVLAAIPDGQRPRTINNVEHNVLIGFFTIFDPPVPPGTGIYATLWFTADGGAADQVVPFDSVKIGPSGDFIVIAQAGNETISPQYDGGSITIGNPQSNTAPVLSPIANQNVAEGASLNVPVSAVDAESDPILSAEGLQPFMGFVDNGGGSGTFTANPGFDDAGVYPVTIIASDGELADTVSFDVTVSNTNRAPVWAAASGQVVNENEHLEFKISATDPDADGLTLTALSIPANASLADSGNGAGGVFFDPDYTQAGNYNFQFIASDGDLSDTLTVQVEVVNVNRAPVWAAAGAQSVDEGQHLEFSVSASDPDADALTIVALSLPANASIADSGNGAAGVFFDPDYTQAGVANVILEVSDGDLTDTLGVSITVNNTNRAPVLDPVAGGSVSVGDSLIIALHATDPDGDPITLALSAPLANAEVVDSGNGSGIFRFLPDSSQAGQNFSRSIIASDGDLDASDVFNFSVNALAAPDSAFVSVDTLFFVPGEVQDGVDNKVIALTSTNAPANYSSAVDPGAYPDFTTVTGSGQTDDSVDIEVDVTGYENGFYYNTVNFTVDGVDNNPVQLVVCVEVNNAPDDTASLTPDSLFFTAQEGSEIIQSGCAFLSSTNAPANWTAVNDTDNVFASAILLSGVTADSVCVEADPSGLAVGTYYDYVYYSVENTINSPRTLVLCMTIEAAPSPDSAFVTPDTFFFSMDEGNNPGLFGCAMVNSTNAPANYTAGAAGDPFFTDLFSSGGTTNDSICFEVVNANSLTPGVYYNDVTINVDGVDNNPVGFVVCLTVNEVVVVDTSILAISDSSFYFESTFGVPFIGGDSLMIMNVGAGPDFGWQINKLWSLMVDTLGDSTYDSTGVFPSQVDIAPLSGVTPGLSFISVDNDSLDPGFYQCAFEVVADSGVLNSPQYVTLTLVVHPPVDTSVQILEVSDSVFIYFATEGEINTICDTLDIYNTGDGPDFNWTLDSGECYFIPACNDPVCSDTVTGLNVLDFVGQVAGTTPSSLSFCFDTDTLPAGQYWCQFAILAEEGVLNSPRNITVMLTVTPPVEPSPDIVWVSTVPATPGSKVVVPVNMINESTICGLTLNLEWHSSKIYLDSVSYVGTRLEGIEKADATIDNNGRTVLIDFDAVSFAMPAGEGKVANLYFEVFSDITEGGIVPITANTKLFCPACAIMADNCLDDYMPQFFEGGIVIDSSANVICGRVVDTAGNEIAGAVVEVWDSYPLGNWYAEDTTGFDGAFKFTELYVVPYSLHAYAEGYYPNTLADINFGSLGLEIVLTPVSEVSPTNEWIDLYCEFNTYMGMPLPVGSVVDAFDPDGDHVGSWFVTEVGKYGFMPVYRDDPFTEEDDGADPGDVITLYINGMPAEMSSEVIWTQNGESFEVCLNFDGSSEKTYCLKPGWNLISWNFDTEIDDVSAVFGSIMQYVDVILSFEEVGLTYDPDLPQFSTLNSADHLHGYWLRLENLPDTCIEWNVTGLPVLVNTPIHMEAGWNLVSYLPTVGLETPAALVSQEGNLIVALGYEGAAQTYEPSLPDFSTLDMMAPCFGYWLKVIEPSYLVYPGFNSAPYIQPYGEDGLTVGPLAKLGVEGELAPTNRWIDIYASSLTLDGRVVGAGSEVRVVSLAGDLVGYGITSAAGELKFTPVYGATSDAERGLHSGESFQLVINGVETNESFTFNERGERVEISALTAKEGSVVLPDDYYLEQNYPNPFNPETKITFQLPEASDITLEVYNVLGARVRTLAAGLYPAGTTNVTWDARGDNGEEVATGLYFYRLKAGVFSQTRKMMLLK